MILLIKKMFPYGDSEGKGFLSEHRLLFIVDLKQWFGGHFCLA